MEPTEEQYLILNALETLELLNNALYDEEKGVWYIQTPSLVLPFAIIRRNGDIVPTTWRS
ncbi:hypothetical protein ACE1B6_16300 [Aerosakkonemataceae cyanobacterium BLCC-F154]|uniref:Uncharacterized protein n=1 Tax=Floridaenema fluviatile BLCC-F154 TaxID=3153640 RepID=A0ABV4YDA5_9CYAN